MRVFRNTGSESLLRVIIFLLSLISQIAFGQVGMTGNNPDKSAVLDISEMNKGLLIPRISLSSTTDVNPIRGNAPVKGLWIYNTNPAITGDGAKGVGFYYWDGQLPAKWRGLMPKADLSNTSWLLGGNSNGREYAIGSKDNVSYPLTVGNNNEIRLNAGSSSVGSLKIGNVPAGADSDKVLVTRLVNGRYEVFQRDPLLIKYTPQSSQSTWKTKLKEVYYGTSNDTYIMDMLYVRIEKSGYFATATFSCQRSVLAGRERNFVLTFMNGGVEPINDQNKNKYSVANVGSIGAYQSNHLRLTYPNAPAGGFDFEIWISVESGEKYLNIKNLSNLPLNNEGFAVTQQRMF